MRAPKPLLIIAGIWFTAATIGALWPPLGAPPDYLVAGIWAGLAVGSFGTAKGTP